MPTPRAYSFIAAALILYFFANQTQVGWLYVVSALLMGTVVAGWWFNRRSLSGLQGQRRVGTKMEADLYEGDEVQIELALRKTRGRSAAHLRLTEVCPLAALDASHHTTRLFVPSLPTGTAVQFTYTVTLDRRGLHEFPPLALTSRNPFGFFERKGWLRVPTRTLVYPEVRPLQRLALLDRQLNAQITRPRAGVGYEVLGVRPYRPGDSPRHIHWRSVARTGELISKEFADDAQPGLTLVLDLFSHPYPVTDSKHTPFEWGIKAAASIGDYARRKGYAVHLLVDEEVIAAPVGAVGWMALLQYLARVQPIAKRPLPQVIGRQVTQHFVAVILPWPDDSITEPLLDLQTRSIELLAVLPDPATFPAGGLSSKALASQLSANNIENRVLEFGNDWAIQLM
jgi:uncharacterized protein (DUF58 family)